MKCGQRPHFSAENKSLLIFMRKNSTINNGLLTNHYFVELEFSALKNDGYYKKLLLIFKTIF